MEVSTRIEDVEAETLKLELRLALLEGQEKAQETFLGFSRYVWPEAIISSHHEIMSRAFDRIAEGTLKRLIVNMPPRHTKSEFASYLLPAYLMGLQPGGAIVIVMTRWGTKDLTARLLKSQSSLKADQWEVIEFPAVFDEGEENERALWPSFWDINELQAVRASMSIQKWNAMYQQKPTSDEGAILKREWWREWEPEYLPSVEYIIQSYDTAFSP